MLLITLLLLLAVLLARSITDIEPLPEVVFVTVILFDVIVLNYPVAVMALAFAIANGYSE